VVGVESTAVVERQEVPDSKAPDSNTPDSNSPDPKAPDEVPVAREAFYQEKPAEKVVEIDPWADLVQKALSETDIGRKFEKPGDRNAEAPRDTSSLRSDRMAG
jgi:hypothetical protein